MYQYTRPTGEVVTIESSRGCRLLHVVIDGDEQPPVEIAGASKSARRRKADAAARAYEREDARTWANLNRSPTDGR